MVTVHQRVSSPRFAAASAATAACCCSALSKAPATRTVMEPTDIVRARKFLPLQRADEAGREDARAEGLRCEVDLLSSKQAQLLQLQVHAAQYQKAYVDERVGSAANEARSNAEALGLAVNQVHADQIVIKEHLGARLQAVEEFMRRQIETFTQDLTHRQFLGLSAVDRRLDELAQNAVSNTKEIVAIRARHDELVTVDQQQQVNRRIDDLEASATLAIKSLETQMNSFEKHGTHHLAQRVEEVAIEAKQRHGALSSALVELERRLTTQVVTASARSSTRSSPALEDLKKDIQLRLFEASSTSTKAISDAEARVTGWVRSELLKLAVSASASSLGAKVLALDGKMAALRATILNPSPSVSALEQRVSEQEVEIGRLRAQLVEQDREQTQRTDNLQKRIEERLGAPFEQHQTDHGIKMIAESPTGICSRAPEPTNATRHVASASEDEEQTLSTLPVSRRTRQATQRASDQPVTTVQTRSAARARPRTPERTRSVDRSTSTKQPKSKLQLAREAAQHSVERAAVRRERQVLAKGTTGSRSRE